MKKITRSIEKQGYFGAGIADFESMYGIPEFVHAMEEIKKPYLVGINITIDEVNLCLFVLSEDGYHHLININTAIQKNELTLTTLAKNSGGLACIIETNHGAFKERFSALEKINTTFTKWLNEYSKLFDSRFYLGVEVIDLVSKAMMEKVRIFAKEYNYQCIAFPRLRYEKKDDAIVLKIVSSIAEGTFIKEKKASGHEYFMTEADYHKIYSENEIEATNDLIKQSQFSFMQKRGEMLHFSSRNCDEELKEMAYEKLKSLTLDRNPEYVERLNYELSTISSMGYSDYFLLVQDYVNWAKREGILVGAGRGSSAGSLVSYLLNIYNLKDSLIRLEKACRTLMLILWISNVKMSSNICATSTGITKSVRLSLSKLF